MYYVYILENNDQRYYIGYTSKELSERVYEHNTSKSKWTKYKGPWELIYSEKYPTKGEAYKREKQIKKYKGGRAFKKLIS